MDTAIAVSGDPSLITALHEAAVAAGIRVSEPINEQSPADMLNAPLNPHHVMEVLQMLKMMFDAGTAAGGFVTVILTIMGQFPGRSLVVKDPRTGKPMGKITDKSTPDEVQALLPAK